jgi:plasmid stabilization system protein ParE
VWANHVLRTQLLLVYNVEGREVFVLRVIHGARDLENLFAG